MIEHIYGNIYIGNSQDARSHHRLAKYNIGAIINCAADLPVFTGHALPYLHLKILPTHEFTPQEAIVLQRFYENYRNVNILVHCHCGMERSPSVVILLLMHLGMSYGQASALVASKRREVKVMLYDNVKRSLERIFA